MKIKIILIASLMALIITAGAGLWWYYNIRGEDDSLSAVKARGVLVVGSDIPFGIMEFLDENNQPVGIDIDIVREIAKRLDVKLEIKDYAWDNLFSAVEKNELDLGISGITITPERQKNLLFSNPYFNGGQVIMVNSDDQTIKGVADLAGQRVGTQVGTTSYLEAKKYTAESDITTYLNFDKVDGSIAIVDDLRDHKFEVIIVDYNQALDMIKKYSGLKIVGVPFTKEEYGIVTKIGHNSLMNKINSILGDMERDGTTKSILSKWIKY